LPKTPLRDQEATDVERREARNSRNISGATLVGDAAAVPLVEVLTAYLNPAAEVRQLCAILNKVDLASLA